MGRPVAQVKHQQCDDDDERCVDDHQRHNEIDRAEIHRSHGAVTRLFHEQVPSQSHADNHTGKGRTDNAGQSRSPGALHGYMVPPLA